jgi:hypothetical protein
MTVRNFDSLLNPASVTLLGASLRLAASARSLREIS